MGRDLAAAAVVAVESFVVVESPVEVGSFVVVVGSLAVVRSSVVVVKAETFVVFALELGSAPAAGTLAGLAERRPGIRQKLLLLLLWMVYPFNKAKIT